MSYLLSSCMQRFVAVLCPLVLSSCFVSWWYKERSMGSTVRHQTWHGGWWVHRCLFHRPCDVSISRWCSVHTYVMPHLLLRSVLLCPAAQCSCTGSSLSLSLSSHTRILHLICMQCSFRGCNIICMRIKACLVHVFLIMNGRGQSFIFI